MTPDTFAVAVASVSALSAFAVGLRASGEILDPPQWQGAAWRVRWLLILAVSSVVVVIGVAVIAAVLVEG